MIEWKVAMGRVTLFPAFPASFSKLSVLQVFHAVWNSDPDNFQKQENPLLPSVAQGKKGGLVLGCALHPSRLDFNFGPASPQAPDPSNITIQLIENARHLRRGLLEVFGAVGDGRIPGEVSRVALNLQMLAVMTDFLEANRALAEVIPRHYGLRLAGEEDVIFQVNKPYDSQCTEVVKMNDVIKWSVARVQVLSFSMPTGGIMGPSAGSDSANPQIKDFIASSVAFEINSAPLPKPISPADQSLLFREALTRIEEEQKEIGLIVEGLRNV